MRTPVLEPDCRGSMSSQTESLSSIRRWLMAYCSQFGGSYEDCEDLVQETMIRTLPVMVGKANHPNWRGYVCQTARNLWIDQVRRRKSSQQYLNAVKHLAVPTTVMDADFLVLEDALYTLLRQASSAQCAVWLLRDVYGYRTSEVAHMLHRSEAAVKSSLHRVRGRLRTIQDQEKHGIESDDTHQRALAKAYAAAIRSADVQQLVELVDSELVDPAEATVKAIRSAGSPYAQQHPLEGKPRGAHGMFMAA